ncbi:putative bifunctional diguanylate cyclase/phosphodiesterase [Solicola sp. PLA-1-18]|uniref:putative bifunctional diguanylate cyclase/phosphodiesterase n=1 Tax=Solicola sp. PLA-1-18 TaxID=3380532 RepID=UPI003B7FA8A4
MAAVARGMMTATAITRPVLLVFVGAGSCFLIGIVLRPSDALSSGNVSGLADAFTFAGYLGLLIFLARMLRTSATTPVSVVLDVLAVTFSVSLVAWVLLVEPAITMSGRSTFDGLRSAAYVAADVLLLAVLVQLAFRRTALMAASLLTVAAMLLLLSGDLTYAAYDAGWSIPVPERYWSLGYLLSFGFFGAMALHPSLEAFLSPSQRSSWSSERARFVLLVAALAVPVALPALDRPEGHVDQMVRVAMSGLVIAAVFARLVVTASHLSAAAQRLKVAEQITRRAAEHDSLTGLLNRRTVLRLIDHHLSHTPGTWHLLYVDLDGFKPINDGWGHTVGDRVLVQVAERFAAALRPGEVLGRVGGDEFLVLTNHDPWNAAGRLRAALDPPLQINAATRRQLSVSVGVAQADADTDAEALMRHADLAMYAVKNSHRDGVAIYTLEMDQALAAQALMVDELRSALGTDQLSMYYQPIVDATSLETRGFEALLRWNSPVLGSVPPNQVIEAAERSHLMGELGEWILRTSMAELAHRLAAHPGRPLIMSINLSPRQLEDGRFVASVRQLLAQLNLDPGLIWLELTETIALAGTSDAAQIAYDLREIGVQVALDDFGTGYAALTHIRELQPEVIKIDRSFISGDGDGLANEAVVTAVIAMSHATGAAVVGEGVETTQQAEHLKMLGCDYLQGFLLGRPAPGAALAPTAPGVQLAG